MNEILIVPGGTARVKERTQHLIGGLTLER